MNRLLLLRFAIALDKHRNFSRAADALRVTQPTFSRRIAELEASLGVRLFERSNRRVVPTPPGKLFLFRARQILADVERIQDDLDDYKSLRSGRLTVGAGPYTLEMNVTDCVARLVARHPLLQIEVVEGHWREFGPKLLSGELELAVMEASIIATDRRFHVEILEPHPAYFYCRAGHPLASRPNVTFQKILEYPLIGTRVPARIFASERLEASAGSVDPTTGDVIPRISISSVAATRAIVKRTDAIGITSQFQVEDEVRNGTLVILDTKLSGLRSGYGIVWLRGRELSPAAQAFITTLKAVESELVSKSKNLAERLLRGHRRR
jgi:DNA-binding transcriptional LysR family regulator